jgi:hypothetical protein
MEQHSEARSDGFSRASGHAEGRSVSYTETFGISESVCHYEQTTYGICIPTSVVHSDDWNTIRWTGAEPQVLPEDDPEVYTFAGVCVATMDRPGNAHYPSRRRVQLIAADLQQYFQDLAALLSLGEFIRLRGRIEDALDNILLRGRR